MTRLGSFPHLAATTKAPECPGAFPVRVRRSAAGRLDTEALCGYNETLRIPCEENAMKAVILNASPRKNWNTAQLLKAAQKGAAEAGA